MLIWISKWAFLQIWFWRSDLFTRASLSAGHHLFLSLSLSFSLSAYTQPLPSQRLPERVGSSWPRFITANSTALLLADGQRSHIMNNFAWFKRTNCYRCKFNLGETHHVTIPRSSSAVCVGEAAFRWCEVMIHVLHYVDCFSGMSSQALGDAYRLPLLLCNDFIHSAAVLDFPILVWCGWEEPLPHKKDKWHLKVLCKETY